MRPRLRLARIRHLGPEHLEGDDVDQHDPDGRVEQLGLVLHEGDGGHALALEAPPVRPRPLHLPAHVLQGEEGASLTLTPERARPRPGKVLKGHFTNYP